MIRLIASDVDGTLIPEGGNSLHPELTSVIRQLKEKGITFVAASGRVYVSVRHAFRDVASDIYFIAVNGSLVEYQDEALSVKVVPEDVSVEVLEYFREQKNVFYVLTTPEQDYTDCDDAEMLKFLREGYRLKIDVVEDASTVKGPFLKMAIYFKDVDAMDMLAEAKERFGDRLSVVVSGDHWIDFVHMDAQKGIALKDLQERLGITKEETMAFGDNDNDVSLLQAAKESYAVSNARENAKEAAKYVLPDTTTETVLRVLKTLL